MLFPSLETILSQGSLLIIFVLMLSNGFFSFPSSQILYITVGVFVAQGKLTLLPVLILGAIANTLGNYALYEVTHKHGEKVAKKFLPISDETLAALKETFKEKSLWWLAVGKLTPSLKVAVPILAGIAKTNRAHTFLVFLITSFVWASAFLSIGIFFGKSFSFGIYGIIMGVIGISIALYFASLVQKKVEEMKK